jgi:hypothetical protein
MSLLLGESVMSAALTQVVAGGTAAVNKRSNTRVVASVGRGIAYRYGRLTVDAAPLFSRYNPGTIEQVGSGGRI